MSLRSFHDLITHTPVGGAFKCELIMAGRGDKVKAIKSSAKAGQSGRKRSRRAETRKNGPRSAPGAERPITRANGADATQAARAVRPCALEATPDPLAGPPGRTGPTPIGRNPGNYSTHAFLADFGRETRPKATRHPARRTWARPGPRTSRFPLRLRPWEPTGRADGPGRLARAAILDRLRRPCRPCPARPIDICGGRARPSRR